jgi:long-chain acyl-CoA synthetase
MNLCEYFLDRKPAAAPALLTLTGAHTYGDLSRAASNIARFLTSSGGRKGDRILILAENELFWVAAYLGSLRAGLVAVPLPISISERDFESIIASAGPTFAFVQWRFWSQYRQALAATRTIVDVLPQGTTPAGLTHFATLNTTVPGVFSATEMAGDDLAALMFTSGSTGSPRGVMVSTNNIIANTESIIQYLGLTPADRILDVLPFHYCFGASLLHTHLRVGGSIVVEPRFMYVEKVLERLADTDCTGFAGVPSHYQILLRKSSLAKRHFPKLRYVQQAGGHLAPTFVAQLQDALPKTRIYLMYGQTEATARLSYLPPDKLDAKRGSAGIAIPGVTLSVLDERGNNLPAGSVGEIVAEGYSVALGYWQDEDATSKKFRHGKLHTGDLGKLDSDGFLFIVDRAGDFLKCGGKRVSCRTIEDALLECELVVEAAVVPMPDDTLGEAVKAFVVPRDRRGIPIDKGVQAFCCAHLPLALVPKEIVIVDKLPKNSSGKVMKHLLSQEAVAVSAH